MLCSIKPVPFHESDKHIFAKIPGGGPDPRSPPLDPPMIWKWIRCCNEVRIHDDCVIKRDVYPQKMHSCSKNISGISVFVPKISVVYQNEYIIGDIAWVFA